MIRFIQILLFLMIPAVLNFSAFAQGTGDFRSKASGNWGDNTTWQVYDGATWNDAGLGQVPGGTSESDADNIYIEAGHTVTLEANHSCKELHLNTTADVIRINTQDNVLEVWGKMRYYEGLAPGAGTPSAVTSSGITGWITTGTNGYIRFKGTADRVVMEQGEVNANNSNSGWNLDFAFDVGFTGQINDRIRAENITITSGTLFVNNTAGELRIGTNGGAGDVTPNGQFLLKSGATLRGGVGIFKKSTVAAESIIVESGADLIITGNNYVLAATILTLDGTVTITTNTNVNFPSESGRSSAVSVNTFTNLILEGTGSKTLLNNVTVNGRLSLRETSSLSVGAFALSYGASGELEYNGTAAQTTTSAEFPSINGPSALIINDSNGVTLHENRILSGQLTLTEGFFLLSNFDLTLGGSSPAIAGTPSVNNMVVTNGTGQLIKIFTGIGSYSFPVGENTGNAEYTSAQLTVNSADLLDETTYFGVRVVDAEHPAASGVVTDDISRYWEVNTNMTGYSYDGTFQYTASDVIGTETNINSFVFSDETALASRLAISQVDNVLHKMVMTDVTSAGFLSAANFGCSINNNSVIQPGTIVYCNSAPSILLDGSVATVTSGTPTYQWQQSVNGGAWTDISLNGQSEDYTEPGPLSSGTYVYKRIVSDPTNCIPASNSTSNEITITVNPSITGNSVGSDQSVSYLGDPAAFTETGTLAGGDGIYTYQWKSSLIQGGPYTNISGATAATYDVSSGLTRKTYYVRQVSSGTCTSVSNEILVNVSCIVVSNPSDVVTCADTDVSFSAEGSGMGITYQWQISKNGGSSYGNLANSVYYSNVATSTLNITAAPASFNNYLYRCVVNGLCTSVYTNPALLTISSASISTHPVNKVICDGSSTTFSVVVTGSGLTYQWQESTDGGTIFNDLANSGVYSTVTTSTLTITGASVTMNNYKYRVIVSASCGPSVTSNYANLKVNTTAAVVSHPSDASICAGTNTSYTASGSGTGIRYQWQVSKNGGSSYGNLPVSIYYSNVATATLTITAAPSSFNGYLYRCAIIGTCSTVYTNPALLTVIGCRLSASQEETEPIQGYPNPFKDEVNIHCSGFQSNVTVAVKDLDGKIVLVKENHPSDETLTFGKELTSGIYIVEMRNDQEVKTLKLVKID